MRLAVSALRPRGPDEVARLEAAVREPLGSGVELCVDLVPETAPEPSGKLRVSRSLVRSEWEDRR